jgi:hypothetical protein
MFDHEVIVPSTALAAGDFSERDEQKEIALNRSEVLDGGESHAVN